MIQTVIKRDGRVVGYNEEKIKAAIRKAMITTEKGEDESLIQKITDRIGMNGKEQMSVEEIQDNVELELMKSSRKEVAKRYIAYRDQRSIARRAKTRDIFLEIIEAKSNDITRENANMNADSPAGMMMKFASETTKPFVDDYLLSPETADAVKGNYLHIHDKDYYPTKSLTCVQHPLDKVLKYGFSAGHGESRPAKRIETASIIGCISLETAQNEMHGGQAIPPFDSPWCLPVSATRHSAKPMNPIPSVPWLITLSTVWSGFSWSPPFHSFDISSGNCLARAVFWKS
jgi:ribonucleoside-triphosphate reductase (formate)